MSRVHRVGVIAGARQSMKTRAEFNAHVATLGTPTTAAADVASTGGFYFDYAGGGSAGYGSAWRPGFDQGLFAGAFDKAAAHGFPSAGVRTAQIGQRVFLRVTNYIESEAGLEGFTRNGVTTDAGGVPSFAQADIFYYYDDATGPMQMNLQLGTGPTPYTW